MKINELSIFNYEQNQVRTVVVDGEPWFVAKDVVAILGYSAGSNVSRLISNVPEEWRGVKPVHTPGGTQFISVISEAGLYFFLSRSDMHAAIPFQRWIAGEVLPTIRKTGGAYLTLQKAEELLHDPNLIIGLAQQVIDLKATTEQQQKQIEADRPKTIFADAVSVSSTTILIGDLAKLLKQNGIDIGQKRLFERMRNEGFLIKSGSSWNMPTQRSMDLGLMQVKEGTYSNPDGSVHITKTTKITGKGQLYFVNKFIEERDRQKVA